MSKHRNHFYMVTVMIAYVREGTVRQQYTNLITQLDDKKITSNAIDVARQSVLQRANLDGGIDPTDFRDVVFMNWSHLGFMTDAEFNDMEDEDKPDKPSPFDA
jgi:hypothetical protein